MVDNLNKNINSLFSNPFIFFLLIQILIFYVFLFPTENAFEQSHDKLDSFFTYWVVRSFQNNFFLDFNYIIPNFLESYKLNYLHIGDLSLAQNFFLIFDPPTAFVVNSILLRLIKFLGMYLLLTDYIIDRSYISKWYASITAFCFSVINFNIVTLGTVSCLPLFLWGILNFYNNKQIFFSSIAILIYPFLSPLVYGGPAACLFILIFHMIKCFYLKQNTPKFWILIFSFFVIYILVESRSIYSVLFDSDYISHRSQKWETLESFNFNNFFFDLTGIFFRSSHSHHASHHYPIITFTVFLSIFMILISRKKFLENIKIKRFLIEKKIYLLIIFLLIFLSSLISSLDLQLKIAYNLFKIPLDLTRLDIFIPVCWYSLFCFSLFVIAKTYKKIGVLFINPLIIIIFCIFSTAQFPGIKENIKKKLNIDNHVGLRYAFVNKYASSILDFKIPKSLTGLYSPINPEIPEPLHSLARKKLYRYSGVYKLKDYYEFENFSKIKKDLQSKLNLNLNNFKTLSFFISPSIAQYHGFHTLDGFFTDYPLEYWFKFNKLFTTEFKKSNIKINEETPRNGLFAFISPYSFENKKIKKLSFDTCLFYKMNGKVIFSFFEIENHKEIGLDFLNEYGNIKVYYINNFDC